MVFLQVAVDLITRLFLQGLVHEGPESVFRESIHVPDCVRDQVAVNGQIRCFLALIPALFSCVRTTS